MIEQEGPWALDHSPESLKQGCLPQNIYRISPTPKSILGISHIITKTYQVAEFNQIILICTISMSDNFTKPKRSGVYIRLNILLATCSTLLSFKFDMQHDHLQKKIALTF